MQKTINTGAIKSKKEVLVLISIERIQDPVYKQSKKILNPKELSLVSIKTRIENKYH